MKCFLHIVCLRLCENLICNFPNAYSNITCTASVENHNGTPSTEAFVWPGQVHSLRTESRGYENHNITSTEVMDGTMDEGGSKPDFVKRNVELAGKHNQIMPFTDAEQARLEYLLGECSDEEDWLVDSQVLTSSKEPQMMEIVSTSHLTGKNTWMLWPTLDNTKEQTSLSVCQEQLCLLEPKEARQSISKFS
ncbi:unnamed protein product, partial [Dicrocoelium dendriticum]